MMDPVASTPAARPGLDWPGRPDRARAGTADGGSLPAPQAAEVAKLKARDAQVRAHEAAHLAAGGSLVRGGPSYSYQQGPDGRSYAVGGEVQIDTGGVAGDPKASAARARQVAAAALAPADPSGQDLAVASRAQATAAQADAKGSANQTDGKPANPQAGTKGTNGQADTKGTAAQAVGMGAAIPADGKTGVGPDGAKVPLVLADAKVPRLPADAKIPLVPTDAKVPFVPTDAKIRLVPSAARVPIDQPATHVATGPTGEHMVNQAYERTPIPSGRRGAGAVAGALGRHLDLQA